jgi:ribonuclease VapC
VRGSRAFALDSYALLAYLNDEYGGSRVAEIVSGAIVGEHHLLLSLINFGEVLYRVERRLGGEATQRVIQFIDRLPIRLADVDRDLTMSAAHVKASHPMSYADAFVAALALRTGGTILTGDPEFRLVEHLVRIEWLPPNR